MVVNRALLQPCQCYNCESDDPTQQVAADGELADSGSDGMLMNFGGAS